MQRLKTPTIKIGHLTLGPKKPIIIQSMTDTDTADVSATTKQSVDLIKAGSEMIRLTINTAKAAKAIPQIRTSLNKKGFAHVPLIGDFHYNGHTLLTEHPEMAKALDKYRINPGNVGFGDKHDYNFAQIIKIAIENNKPIRIGVNIGSLDQDLLTDLMNKNAKLKNPKTAQQVTIEAMTESALRSARLAEKLGMKNTQILLSVKMSELPDCLAAYRLLATKMIKKNHYYGIHVGLTEAGPGLQGTVSSSAALGILLNEGIGDTIRVSITPNKKNPRTTEVEVCKELLQSLGLRYFKPKVTACPGCGRTDGTFFQELATDINTTIQKNLPQWQKKYHGVEKLKISVMGCIVNGPGEAKYADIAISLPGKSEKKGAPIYIKGKYHKTLQGKNICHQFIDLIEAQLTKKD